MSTELGDKLRALAPGRADADRLIDLAQRFDEASIAFYSGKGDVKKMMGCWARARRAYCDITGEDLV